MEERIDNLQFHTLLRRAWQEKVQRAGSAFAQRTADSRVMSFFGVRRFSAAFFVLECGAFPPLSFFSAPGVCWKRKKAAEKRRTPKTSVPHNRTIMVGVRNQARLRLLLWVGTLAGGCVPHLDGLVSTPRKQPLAVTG